MDTIGYMLSRLRNDFHAVKQDPFLTDRYLYSKVMKFVPALLKREDGKNLLMQFVGIWQTLKYVELIDVPKVDTKCFGITSSCTIKRSRHKLPELFMGYRAPLIKTVTGISGPATDADDEAELTFIESSKYASIVKVKSFKYNKTKYFWYADGYLWFPNMEWDAVRVEGLFNADISTYDCETCKSCITRQDQPFSVPEYLYPEIESFVFKDLGMSIQLPQDPIDDKINPNRT